MRNARGLEYELPGEGEPDREAVKRARAEALRHELGG